MAKISSILRQGLLLLPAVFWLWAGPVFPGEDKKPPAPEKSINREESISSDFSVPDETIFGYRESAEKTYSPGLAPAEQKKRIKKIKVTGCDKIACRTVKSILRQKPTPWWKRDPGDEGYDLFWADDDRNRIILFYRSKGYYQVQVDPPRVVKDKNGRSVTITHVITQEGEPVRVERIEIVFEDGLHDDRDPMTVRALLKFKEGEPFELTPYQGSARAMSLYYQDLGFFRARVERRAVVDPEKNTARVTYRITRGRRFKIRKITIEGCDKTDPEVVSRAMKLEEGDRYGRADVIADQRRVQRLPIYRTVRVIETADDENKVIDLTIKVEEADPHQVKVGVGYGTEEQVRVMGMWRHVNFLGGARELTASARWSMLLEQEQIVFVQPNLSRSGDFVRVSLERRLEVEEAYTHEAWSFSPTYHFILTNYLFAELSYRIEWNRLSNVLNQLELEDEDLAREGVLSALSGKLEWADLDSVVNPTLGARAILWAEVGGGPLSGDFSYYKIIGEVRGYYPVFPPVVGAVRAKMGYAEPFGDMNQLPLFLRFYTGGTGLVRGFGRYELGPEDAEGRPIGGVRLWEGSLELRFPVWEAFGGVTFMDAGWVWPEGEDYSLADIQYAAGFGVRYSTPIGPLALDLAFPLDQDSDALQYRIHFNVGHSF